MYYWSELDTKYFMMKESNIGLLEKKFYTNHHNLNDYANHVMNIHNKKTLHDVTYNYSHYSCTKRYCYNKANQTRHSTMTDAVNDFVFTNYTSSFFSDLFDIKVSSDEKNAKVKRKEFTNHRTAVTKSTYNVNSYIWAHARSSLNKHLYEL